MKCLSFQWVKVDRKSFSLCLITNCQRYDDSACQSCDLGEDEKPTNKQRAEVMLRSLSSFHRSAFNAASASCPFACVSLYSVFALVLRGRLSRFPLRYAALNNVSTLHVSYHRCLAS